MLGIQNKTTSTSFSWQDVDLVQGGKCRFKTKKHKKVASITYNLSFLSIYTLYFSYLLNLSSLKI